MYCPNCGGANAPTNNNCTHCGAVLPAEHYTPSRVEVLSRRIHTDAPAGMSLADHERLVHSRVREVATGPVFLVAMICYCASVLFQLIAFAETSIVSQLSATLSQLGISSSELDGLGDFLTILQFICMLPGILTAAGLVMVFVSAQNAGSTGKISSSGLTIIHVLQIISLVLVSVVAGLGLLALFGALGAASDYYGVEDVISTTIFIYILIMGFSITYLSFIVRSVSAAKRTLETGIADTGVSVFVGVMCCISGGFTILGMLSDGIDLASLLSGVATLLFGVVIFLYKSAMSSVAYISAVSAPAPVAPPPMSPASSGSFVPTWKRLEMEEQNNR